MNRRDFITTATTASMALAISGCNDSNRQAIDYSKHHKTKDIDKKRVYFNRNKKTTIRNCKAITYL